MPITIFSSGGHQNDWVVVLFLICGQDSKRESVSRVPSQGSVGHCGYTEEAKKAKEGCLKKVISAKSRWESKRRNILNMGASLGRGPEECEWSTFRKSQGTGDGMVYVRE